MKDKTREVLTELMSEVASGACSFGERLNDTMVKEDDLSHDQIREMAVGIIHTATTLAKTIHALLEDEKEEDRE